jgi:shikimate dehydrogenase
MANRYAVVGNPISHSRSPWIHSEFARQTGEDLSYERILAPLGGFETAVSAFWRSGGSGLNVTVPFKREAARLADRLSPRAQVAGAVNTLKASPRTGDGNSATIEIVGENTDGVGLVRDIRDNLGRVITGQRVLILGAGGAARGIIGEIAAERPIEIAIANRTLSNAQALVADLSATLNELAVNPYALSELPAGSFDIVINATSATLDGDSVEISAHCFGKSTLAYDLMYGSQPSAFLQLAQLGGAEAADGIGMLVEQAAEAFWFWRGIRPDTRAVLAMLKNAST